MDFGDRVWFIGEVVHAEAEEGLDRSKLLIYWNGELRTPGDVIMTVTTTSERCCGLHHDRK